MFAQNTVSVTICDNRPFIGRLKRRHYCRLFGQKMSDLAGGASVLHGTGYWNSDTKGLISESNDVVYTICDNPDQVYQDLLPLIHEYMRDCNQEAVLVTVGGRPEFISQDEI